ncbi:MAG: hypothetical protein ACK5Y2_09180 [Bdellovibrionales bacterium]
MKIVLGLAIALFGFSFSALAHPKATITCLGDGQTLVVSFLDLKPGYQEAAASFGRPDQMVELSEVFEVNTNLAQPGELEHNYEVRIYEGFYIADDLKLGFVLSVVINKDGQILRFGQNRFLVNREPVGTCSINTTIE